MTLRFVFGLVVWMGGTSVLAQEGPAASATSTGDAAPRVTMSVATNVTFTDNVRLSSAGKQSELVTEVRPGIRIQSRGGLAKGYVDYGLSAKSYSNGSSAGTISHQLAALGTLEAIPGQLGMDLAASAGVQTISAAGMQQSGSGLTLGGNQAEVFSYQMAPYLRGQFSRDLAYDLRITQSGSRSNSGGVSDVSSQGVSFGLKGGASGARLSWAANGSARMDSYSAGRKTEFQTLGIDAAYAVTPQLQLTSGFGQETNNFATVGSVSNVTNRLGLSWQPTEQSRLSWQRQVRPFGTSHSSTLAVRTGRTSWQYVDGQDVTTTPGQESVGSLGTVYDIYFAQFESVEPDPVRRAALVQAYLQSLGLAANTQVLGGFRTSALSVQRRQNLSVALQGIRSTVTVIASRTATHRLDFVSTALDDLINGSLLQQQGFSINWGHRLTPVSSLNINLSSQNTSDSAGLIDSSSMMANLGVSMQLGRRSSAGMQLRRVVQDSRTSPYNETAISGNWTFQF
ncbi:MAG: hypothetical protein RLZZ126_969 [Pseudomonadota bacterium]